MPKVKAKKQRVRLIIRFRETKQAIAYQDITFTDPRGRGFRGSLFQMTVLNHADEFMKQTFRVDATVPRKGTKLKPIKSKRCPVCLRPRGKVQTKKDK